MTSRVLASLCLLLLLGGVARAHVVVTAELVQQTLAQVSALRAVATSDVPAEERADALFELGGLLARTTEILNRDYVTHDGLSSLEASALIAQLAGRGYRFSFDEDLVRYRQPLEPMEQAIALAPDDPRVPDTRFALLAIRFYESFTTDPSVAIGMDYPALLAHMESVQTFLDQYPGHRAADEARFILAVDYTRAASMAPDAETRTAYREAAFDSLSAYVHDHPLKDLRTLMARRLLEGLEP